IGRINDSLSICRQPGYERITGAEQSPLERVGGSWEIAGFSKSCKERAALSIYSNAKGLILFITAEIGRVNQGGTRRGQLRDERVKRIKPEIGCNSADMVFVSRFGREIGRIGHADDISISLIVNVKGKGRVIALAAEVSEKEQAASVGVL